MAFSDLSRRKRIALGLVGVVALAGGGVAIAAWIAGGTGTGAAEATSAIPLTVSDGTTVEQLYPGATGNIIVDITNPNPYPVRIDDFASSGSVTSDAGEDCQGATTGVSYLDSGTTDDEGAIIEPDSTETITLDGAVEMSNDSDNSCQDAIFSIPLSASGESAAE